MLRHAIVLCALLCAGEAYAQVSGSVTLLSDFRYRGISLSDGDPAAQIALNWDGPGGAYAGALASSARLDGDSGTRTQLAPYLGYAHRLRPGLSWDVGVIDAIFVGGHDYDYADVYAGLAGERFGLRLHYAHRYFGEGPPVLYAEGNGSLPLSLRLRLLGHVGVLRRNGGSGRYSGEANSRYRYDASVGAGLTLGAYDLQLRRVASGGGVYYRFGYPAHGAAVDDAWTLSVSRTW
ncbi:MAG TPA: TorF family putative porin [Mizugakiibacter sp.]